MKVKEKNRRKKQKQRKTSQEETEIRMNECQRAEKRNIKQREK